MTRGVYGSASSSGGIWNVIQLIFIVSGVAFYFSYYRKRERVIGVLLLYSLWIMLVSLVNSAVHPFTSVASFFYSIMCPCTPLVLLIFYCAGQENGTHCLSFCIKATYYILIVMYYISMTNYRTIESDEYIAFSDIYYPLCLLPLVLMNTKPIRSLIPILAIIVGIIISGKRGGLIVVALVAIVYYLFRGKSKRRGSVFMLLFLATTIWASSYFIAYLDAHYGLQTINRMINAAEDGGSGRVERWHLIWSEIETSSLWQILFGHGFDSVSDLVGSRAHNDFLEVLYNYGLFSFGLYLCFHIGLIMTNIRQFRKRYPLAKFFTCSIIISLVMAMVSFYIVEPTYVLSSMFVTGLILGDWATYNKSKNQSKEYTL